MHSLDWASTASAFFAGLSALAATATIYFSWRIQSSQEILNQTALSLERAYMTLTNNGTETKPPAADRLNWLTAARHIERYKKLKAKLAFDTHRVVCEEQEEYWRHKIYTCLDAPHQLSLAYYKEKPHPERRAEIEPRSALIIHDFAKWPEGREDPIDKVDINTMMSRKAILEGNHGLKQYLDTLPRHHFP